MKLQIATLIMAVAAIFNTGNTGAAQTAPTADSALNFLYRYMPEPDRAMYDTAFWRQNVEASLRARAELPWGASVPLREWYHFVLPVRANNENLDMSRPVFYAELKERVKGLGMKEAILEVNHWCHEKVTYRASDARTSSPLSCVSQAIGRCGEESTFAVAALRSVGIPARQVYTPRWAHTDDNHAWVEAWADGKWYFLGACEPEPILNLAWFNQPASRGMMMHTNVFGGDYDGPEEVMDRNRHYTTINVTANYAPTALTTVKVTDVAGKPVKDARVAFCVYNYAEYYPVAVRTSDSEGNATLSTGRGDMVIFASDGTHFGMGKVTAGSSLTVPLQYSEGSRATLEFDLVPPPSSATLPQATPQQRALNDRRMVREDSIRNAYTATFATSQQAYAAAQRLGLPVVRYASVITASRGNHAMIEAWLDSLQPQQRAVAFDLLESLCEKDRRDVSREVLDDCLSLTPQPSGRWKALHKEYVLNPRVENELLTPYRAFFGSVVKPAEAERYRGNAEEWIARVRRHIKPDDTENPKRLRKSPEAVWRTGIADALSANICLVAGLRSFGVPARIDPVTGKTQYASKKGEWVDVNLFNTPSQEGVKGGSSALFKAAATEHKAVAEPRYYSHFSLSKLGDASSLLLLPVQMGYPEGMTLQQWLDSKPLLDAGEYLLTTGQRLADGTVLARTELFSVGENDKEVKVPVVMRHDDSRLQVIGSLDAETLYQPMGEREEREPRSLLSTAGRGYYVLGLIAPNHEPSAHVLADIQAAADKIGALPNKIILLFADAQAASRFTPLTGLPLNVCFGTDVNGRTAAQLQESLKLTSPLQKPVIVIADSFGRVVYVSEGYVIGTADRLLQLLPSLK